MKIMKKIRIIDLELAYRDEGEGQPIVFLHAFPLNQTMWDEQIDAFSADYRVITFDWRGFGASTQGERRVTMDVLADDLEGLLVALNIGSATICGLSMGGYAALAFYRRFSSRVKSLILCDTRATADSEEARATRLRTAESVRASGPSAIAEQMATKLLGPSTVESRPATVARVRGMIESNRSEAIAQAQEGMAARPDSSDLLGRIVCPTLVMVGREDQLTPQEEVERMAERINAVRFEVITQAGHLPNLERPAEFNRLLDDFLVST
jgi:pimeloyl-ACP methyl ester carboxylesterase